MPLDYSVLFAVLHYGETEFSDCILSILNRVSTTRKDIKCFPYMDMRDAHTVCYSAFEEGEWDFLVKVDADMVFERDLTPCLDNIYKTNKVLHCSMLIDDAYTGISIPALHIFRRGHQFGSFENSKNYMYSETTDLKIGNQGIVCHGKKNDPFQAFRTGYYRAMRYDINPKPFLKGYLDKAKCNEWLNAGVTAYQDNPSPKKIINFSNDELYERFIEFASTMTV